jgi:hypothetical protein
MPETELADGSRPWSTWLCPLCGCQLNYEQAKGTVPDGLQLDHLCRARLWRERNVGQIRLGRRRVAA